MRHRKRNVLGGLLVMTALTCLCGVTPHTVSAQTFGSSGRFYQEEETTPVELSKVDKSKGVTWIYNESGAVSGINLNGNSVIIESAKNPDDENGNYCKIYIDSNANGVVDNGETAQKLPSLNASQALSEYIQVGPAIYGVYKAKTEDPICISGQVNGQTIYTVYEGAACDVKVALTGGTSAIFGAYNSTLTGDVTMTNTKVNASALFAVSGGTVTGDIVMTNQNVSAGSVMAAYNSTVIGDVTLNLSADKDFRSNCGTVYAANSTDVTGKVRLYQDGAMVSGTECAVCTGSVQSDDPENPAVLMDVKNGSSSGNYIGAVQGTRISSKASTAVKFTAVDHELNGSVYINNSSQIEASGDAPIALDLDVTGASTISGGFAGVLATGSTLSLIGDVDVNIQLDTMPSYSTGEIDVVKGNFRLDGNVTAKLKNLYASSIYGSGGYSDSTYDSVINGDVTIDMTSCQSTGAFYGANYSYIKGNLSVTGDRTTCMYNYFPSNYATVDKNIKMEVYGYEADTSKASYSTFQGIYYKYKEMEYSVGSAVDMKLLGGSFSSVYALNYNSVINGSMDFAMSGVSITSSSNSYGVYSAKIGGDVTVTADKNCSFACSFSGINSSTVAGNATIDIYSSYVSQNSYVYNNFYGVSSSDIGGVTNISVTGGMWYNVYGVNNNSGTNPNILSENYTVSLQDLTCTNYIYGLYGGKYKGTVDCSIRNIKGSSSSMYGITYGEIDGTVDIKASDFSDFSYIYLLGSGSVAKNITVTASGIEPKQNFYAKNYEKLTCGGNINFILNDINAPYWYGLGGTITSAGSITLTATDCTSTEYTYITGNADTSAAKGIQMDFNACDFVNVSNISFVAYADNEINFNGGNIELQGQISNINGSAPAKANINFKGVAITAPKTASQLSITNYSGGDVILEIIFDDKCTLPKTYEVIANGADKSCPTMVHLGNEYYYAGKYPVDAAVVNGADIVGFCHYLSEIPQITAKKILFRDCSTVIPENVTLTATNQFVFNNNALLLEGTLTGACDMEMLGSTFFYMNGGKITEKLFDSNATKYYRVSLDYDQDAMTVSHTFSSVSLREGILFAKPGSQPTVTVTMKDGYLLGEGTILEEGESSASTLSYTTSGSKTIFKYDMNAKTVAIKLNSSGVPIVVGKTVADPVAILDHTYTAESPLYDFNSLLIYNDAVNDKKNVTYTLADGQMLPTGLVLEENKIIGTATVEDQTGTPVKFIVTGKNGSMFELTLNMIVSSDPNTIQSNQDGRIIVDDTAKSINCMGSSVILKACEEGTAIYLDDNRDGIADHEVPAVKGDYSAYTLYGMNAYESNKPIQILMEGGTLSNLYAVYAGKVNTTDCGESVKLILKDGKITGNAYGLYANSTATEGVCVDCTNAAVTASKCYAKDSGSSCKYGYADVNGAVSITGTYTIDQDLNVNSLTINAGSYDNYNMIHIAKGVAVTAENVTISSNTNLYNKGTLNCTGKYTANSSSIKHFVIGDAKVLPEDNAFAYLYYPMKLTYEDLPDGVSAPALETNNSYCDIDGVLYGSVSDKTTYMRYTRIPGYTIYYSVNNKDEISLGTGSSSASNYTTYPACVKAPMQIKMFYVPNELEAVLKFNVPAAKKGTEYTESEPLYDYHSVTLKNDTLKEFGQDVSYQLQPGSKLPSGLVLEDGKVIGTPTGEDGSTVTTSVIITGRNGSSVTVTLDYVIEASETEDKGINDKISYDGKNLDLNGTSVVMYADAVNTSCVNIYLDENHDGIADNDKAFVYKDNAALNLAYATVYGYRDTTKAYDGDITVYAYAGNIGKIYGAYGTSQTANVTVNGKVSLFMQGASVTSELAAGYYATAKECNLYCTAGTMKGSIYAAYCPVNVEKVNFRFTDTAYYTYYNSSSYLAVTSGGNVTGDVTAVIGGTTNGLNNTSNRYNYCRYEGVYQTTVGGDVNYTIQGNWYNYTRNNHFAGESVIAGNMNVDWKKGKVSVTSGNTSMQTFAYNCTIQDLNIRVAENATMSGNSTMYPYYGGKIQRVYMDIPESFTGSIYTDLKHPYASTVTYPEKSGYLNHRGICYIMGDYTIDETTDVKQLYVYENSKLTIAEGVTLTVSDRTNIYGDLENYGVLQTSDNLILNAGAKYTNYGTLDAGQALYVNADSSTGANGAKLINKGTMTTSSYVYCSGAITNDGTWTAKNSMYIQEDGASISNSGEWNSMAPINVNDTNVSITNEGIWTADGIIAATKAGTTIVNHGEWTTNKSFTFSGVNSVITNDHIWNMNYGIRLSSNAKLVNAGSFIGKYMSTNASGSVYVEGYASVVNSGSWEGNAYLYLYNAIFDNAGTMEINPGVSESSAAFYATGKSSLINRENALCHVKAYMSMNISATKLINYGTFKQSYQDSNFYRLGNVYAAKPLILAKELSDYTKNANYVKFYYPVTVDCPDTAVTGYTVATGYKSGIEGDENTYLLGGASFTLTLKGYRTDFSAADVQSVTYGSAETKAATSNIENQWKGTVPYEAVTIHVNVVKNDATQIVLDPDHVTIDKLTVNQYNSSIYDLHNLTITGDDDEAEGEVAYAVSTAKPLPEGLTLSDGVISGTPKKAYDEPYTTEIIVTGKNLTKATFTIVFQQIEKAVPSLSVPTGMYGYTDYKLSQVRGYNNPSSGTFSWPDSSVVITEKCLAGEKFDLYFTPKDTDNYDWSKISASTGKWNAKEGRVECQVSIRMYTIAPKYTVPTDLEAVYGQTLADVKLPSDEDGTFEWRSPSTSVGTVGTRRFYANYIPTDTGRYSNVTYISISVQVNAKEMQVPVPAGLKTFKGNTIGQVELPEVEGGTYKWVTASGTIVEDGQQYKLVFVPDDTTNYNWVAADGISFSNAYNGYVIETTVQVIWHEEGVHDYQSKYDDTYHWKECICGDIIDKEEHSLGTPKDQGADHIAACTKDGCEYTLESAHVYTKKQDADYHWSECECGDVISKYAHSYSKTVYNETAHWKECSCGIRSTEEAHNYKLSKADSTSHWKQCSCGAKSNIEKHDFNTIAFDGDNHWYVCSCKTKNGVEPHSYGKWIYDDKTDGHYAVCDCGAKKTAAHQYGDYESTGDTEHKQICSDCGKTVTSQHTWDAGVITITPTEISEGLRIDTCTACGQTREVTLPKNKPPHTFDKNLMSYDANEHWRVCDDGDEYELANSRAAHSFSDWKTTEDDSHYKECICGYRVYEAKHTWKYTYDEDSHWYECTVCKAVKNKTAHSYENKSDEVNHWKECVCQSRIDVEQHAYTEYGYNAKTHWDVCSCGKKVNVSAHSYGKWIPDEQNHNHYRICVCGSRETAEHSNNYSWTSDGEENHTGVCADCGGGSLTETHTWNSGKVTTSPTTSTTGIRTYTCTKCQAVKTEEIAKLPEEHKHTFDTWLSDDAEHWQQCSCGDEQKRGSHSWNAGTVTQEPTETEEGVKVYKCTVCAKEKTEILPTLTHTHKYSDTYTYDEQYHWRSCSCNAVTDKAGHTWDQGTLIEAATLEKTGKMRYACTVCNAVKLTILPKLEETHEHNFGAWISSDDQYHTRTCSCGVSETKKHNYGGWITDDKSRHKRVCADCGHEVYDEHIWDSGKVTTVATETTEGIITYTCKICNGTKTQHYAYDEHVHNYGKCTSVDENFHMQICQDASCQNEYLSRHVFDEGTVTTQPTIQTEGVMTYTCTECGYKKTEAIAKLPHTHQYGKWMPNDTATHKKQCDCGEAVTEAHNFDAGVVSVQPTETQEGVMTYTCVECGYVKTEAIAKLVHTHNYGNWTQNDASTHKKQCSSCGELMTEAHNFDAGVITVQPTQQAEGVKTYTCTVCGAAKTETIDKLPADPTDPNGGNDPSDDDLMEGEPAGTKLKVPGSDVTYIVVDPSDVDALDEDDSPAVSYAGDPKSKDKTITIPDTIIVDDVEYRVIRIESGAFKNNKSVKKIIIGENVVEIGDSAFEGCTALTTVTFKKNADLKTIGKKAFYKCIVLKKITIPKNVETIKDSAFDGCKKLASITFQSGSKLKTLGKKVLNGCVTLKKITLPKNLVTIGANAFRGCKKLTKITIQSAKLKSVGKNTFKGIKSNAVIRVPKKKLSSYKKLLKNKGQGKKVKITK